MEVIHGITSSGKVLEDRPPEGGSIPAPPGYLDFSPNLMLGLGGFVSTLYTFLGGWEKVLWRQENRIYHSCRHTNTSLHRKEKDRIVVYGQMLGFKLSKISLNYIFLEQKPQWDTQHSWEKAEVRTVIAAHNVLQSKPHTCILDRCSLGSLSRSEARDHPQWKWNLRRNLSAHLNIVPKKGDWAWTSLFWLTYRPLIGPAACQLKWCIYKFSL